MTSLSINTRVTSPDPDLAGQTGTVVDMASGVVLVEWRHGMSWHKAENVTAEKEKIQ